MSGRTFGIIPAGMAFDPKLGKVALRVGMLMAVHASKARKCWLATETMAHLLQIDRSAVSRALAELVDRGHVTRVRRSIPGRGLTSSVYTLVNRLPAAPEILADSDEAGATEERAASAAKVSGAPVNQSAGLGAEFTPPAPADADPLVQNSHHRPRPAGADSAHPAGAETAEPLVQNSHQNQYGIRIRDQEDDDDRARARASSSSTPDDFSEEGQALLIFDELAGRVGWPRAGRLTSRERKAMAARLAEAGGLAGWRLAMEKAEASNYLGRTKPGLPFFLAEDTFAQLMRGRYDPERDPEPTGMAAVFAGLAEWARDGGGLGRHAEPTPEPQQPERAPPPDPLAVNLGVIGRYTGKSSADMQAIADGWLQRLEATGIDPSTAREIVSDEARMVPKSWSALDRMEERIAARLQARAA